jgi:hypothetical protein
MDRVQVDGHGLAPAVHGDGRAGDIAAGLVVGLQMHRFRAIGQVCNEVGG